MQMGTPRCQAMPSRTLEPLNRVLWYCYRSQGFAPRPAHTKQAPTSHHLGVVWLEKQALLEIQIQER